MYDNDSAACTVSGRVVIRKDPHLCKLACALHRVVAYRYTLHDHPIKSHYHHPWNEYVDSLCTFFDSKPQESKVCLTPISPGNAHLAFCIDSASVYECDQIMQSLQPADGWNAKTQIGLSSGIIGMSIDNHVNVADSLHVIRMCNVKVMQYNIRTFVSEDARKAFFVRVRKDKIGILSLQETREPKVGVVNRNGYVCCMSGSLKGNLGCQICFCLTTPFYNVDDDPMYISSDNVSILDYSPRHLLCKCTMEFCVFYVVNVHAPYLGCKVDPVLWWKSVSSSMAVFCKPDSTIIALFDGNVRFFKKR